MLIKNITDLLARLSPGWLRRFYLLATKQTGGRQVGSHSKLQCHGYPLLDDTVILREHNRYVLAVNATLVEERPALLRGDIDTSVLVNAIHDGRDTVGVDVRWRPGESHRYVELPFHGIRTSNPQAVIDDHHQVLSPADRRSLFSQQMHEEMILGAGGAALNRAWCRHSSSLRRRQCDHLCMEGMCSTPGISSKTFEPLVPGGCR